MKAVVTEGLTAGTHEAKLTDIQVFSGINQFRGNERNVILRLTWATDSGKTSQLVNLQVENNNAKINKGSKLGKIITACGISLDSDSEINFGSPSIDNSFANAEELKDAPELKEMSEEGFKPLAMTYFTVDGVSFLNTEALINVIDAGENVKIDSVVPKIKKSKARKQLEKPITESETEPPF
jgi:hypothetical protein